jgi:hypothetical protein
LRWDTVIDGRNVGCSTLGETVVAFWVCLYQVEVINYVKRKEEKKAEERKERRK